MHRLTDSTKPFACCLVRLWGTGDEAFKSICRVLGPLTKKPTLGVQHAVEAGYLFKEHASISAWLFNFLSYCEVTKPLSRIKTITRMRRIYKRRLVIAGFIISVHKGYNWSHLGTSRASEGWSNVIGFQ